MFFNDHTVKKYPGCPIALHDMVITKYDLESRGYKSQLKTIQIHDPFIKIDARRFIRRTKDYRKYIVDDIMFSLSSMTIEFTDEGDGIEVIGLDPETIDRLNYLYYEYSGKAK